MDHLRLRISVDKIKIIGYAEKMAERYLTFIDCFKPIQLIMFTIHTEGAG